MTGNRKAHVTALATSLWISIGILLPTALLSPAHAQDNRPLRIIVPLAPGGPVDIGARALVPHLEPRLKQPIIIENRPGGGNSIGAQVVASAPADGLTHFFQVASTTTPVFVKDLALDFAKDFEPVAPVWTTSYVMFIHSSVPARNIREFIDYAKANPGKLNYAAGTASTMLSMEMLKNRAGIDVVGIPYKGSAPALTALLANEVQAAFDVAGLHKPYVDSGKERALFATDKQRSVVFPDVPTASEVGLPDMELLLTGGFWTRAGSPAAQINRINAAVNEVLAMPDIDDRYKKAGWFVKRGSPADLRNAYRYEADWWAKAAKLVNYKPE